VSRGKIANVSSTLLHRWTARNTADGTLFYPPEGQLVAGIHVRERLRPLERTHDLVTMTRMQLASNVTITKSGPIERIQTDEGELGALVQLEGTGRGHGRPMRYSIGFVFGDDFYDRLDAYFTESPKAAEYHDLMRAYLVAYRLNLGQLRARRFYYDPPKGWQGRARGILAQWLTPDYPKRVSQLIVPAAFPSAKIEASVMARAVIQRRLVAFQRDLETMDAIAHPAGFETQIHRVHGSFANEAVTDLLTAVVTDQEFVFVVRLESMAEWLERDREALLALVQSIQPLPRRKLDYQHAMSWLAE
jgi:hypothetical protein